MSLNIPLSVRLSTSRTDRHVTRDLRDLRFRTVVPGGYASLSMSLDRPISLAPDEIAYYGKVYVYDGRNGNVVWEGRLEDPGRGVRSDGQVWQINAVGPSAYAKDRTVPLIYVDRRLDVWLREASTFNGLDTIQDKDSATQAPGIKFSLTRGVSVTAAAKGGWGYRAVRETVQRLARLSFAYNMGVTDSNNRLKVVFVGGASSETPIDIGWTTVGSTASAVVTTDFDPTRDRITANLVRNTSTLTVASDDEWCLMFNVVARAQLKDTAGSDITTAASYTLDTVLASEVVKDLLGRLLTAYDGPGSSVTTTSYAIEQLAYPDGVSADQVLNDLIAQFEPGYYWAAWESNSAGKYRFEWTAWPTTVRYECDASDGFDSPGSADGLYNAARVRWKSADGVIKTNQRTQTVPELTAAGLTREAFIDLGDNSGSSANADRAGDQFLSEHRYAPNAGRLTVARPIVDLVAGRMVQPWEIKPGQLIRVRGVLPRIDALNTTTRDGVTVFKVASMEYDTASASAVLELDSNAVSTSRQVADLQQRPIARRR